MLSGDVDTARVSIGEIDELLMISLHEMSGIRIVHTIAFGGSNVI